MRTPRLPRLAKWLLAVSVIGLFSALPACGGGAQQPAGSTKLTMSDFKFSPGSATVASGKVTFFLVNGAADAHDMVIEDGSSKVVGRSAMVQAGDATTFTVNLTPGNYAFYCDIPGHRESGMMGTLTVN